MSGPIAAEAMIDTGSGRSIIQADLARQLGLTSVGGVEIDTPSSTDMPAPEYLVEFWFDETTSVIARALSAPLPVPNLRALIGRDVLSAGRFVYDGGNSVFTLELPSKRGLDVSAVRGS